MVIWWNESFFFLFNKIFKCFEGLKMNTIPFHSYPAYVPILRRAALVVICADRIESFWSVIADHIKPQLLISNDQLIWGPELKRLSWQSVVLAVVHTYISGGWCLVRYHQCWHRVNNIICRFGQIRNVLSWNQKSKQMISSDLLTTMAMKEMGSKVTL